MKSQWWFTPGFACWTTTRSVWRISIQNIVPCPQPTSTVLKHFTQSLVFLRPFFGEKVLQWNASWNCKATLISWGFISMNQNYETWGCGHCLSCRAAAIGTGVGRPGPSGWHVTWPGVFWQPRPSPKGLILENTLGYPGWGRCGRDSLEAHQSQ